MSKDIFFSRLYNDMGVEFFYLYKTISLEEHSSDIKEVLEELYNPNKGEFFKRLATIFNAVFAQNSQTFLLSKRTLLKLMQEDKNTTHGGLSSRDYKFLLAKITNSSSFITLRPPTNNHAGVYKMIDPYLVSLLVAQVGQKALLAQEKAITNYYDTKVELNNEAIDEWEFKNSQWSIWMLDARDE